MKKVFTVAAISAAIFMTSCSNGADNSTDNTATTNTATTVTNPGKMNDFMALLDGTDGSSKKAADAYFSDSLKTAIEETNNITFTDFNLSEAKVISVDGQCCVMETKAGVTTRNFKLCWQDDKVSSIEDLGIQ